jgi:hypothetical protein
LHFSSGEWYIITLVEVQKQENNNKIKMELSQLTKYLLANIGHLAQTKIVQENFIGAPMTGLS